MKRKVAVVVCLALSVANHPATAVRAELGRSTATPPDFDHVVVLVLENKEYEQIIGSVQAPYINSLADDGALATRFYAIRHPSLPNYLALIGGSTFGVTTDCTSCHVGGRNLIDQLEAAGISWKGYMGGMPHACFRASGEGLYAKRHDPFMYFSNIYNNPDRCHRVQPIENMLTDIRNDRLPQYSFVSPDLCKDMHDCSVRAGDRYLSRLVPRVIGALGANGVLFLTFDEGSSDAGCCRFAHGGHIATVVAGPAVASPSRRPMPYDLYSILRTIEEAWGLPLLRKAGCSCTEPMTALF